MKNPIKDKDKKKETRMSPTEEIQRVYRGGSWYRSPLLARLSGRYGLEPGLRDDGLGFRIARNKNEKSN